MRSLALAAALFPLPALADVITLNAPPVAVTAYAQGAIVTRTVTFDIPTGQHDLRIADMDSNLNAAMIDIALSGATLFTRSWDRDGSGPYRAPRTPEWLAAKAAFDQATEALAQRDDAIALALAKAQAAQDQIDFLNGISLPDEAATDVDTLRAIGQLIASDGTAARSAMRAAEAEARSLRQGRDDLAFAMQEAAAALEEVTPPNTNPAALTLIVEAAQAGPVTLTLRYPNFNAQWAPTYEVFLQADDTLRIERGAYVAQNTSEDWVNVDLTLSTLSPFAGSEPGTLWPLLRRIEDPVKPAPSPSLLRSQSGLADSAMSMEAPVIVEETATASSDLSGIGVSYALPGKVTVRTGEDVVRIALDTIEFEAALSARAVPARNQTAFRLVEFDNTSPEILLPGQAVLYVDGQLVGETALQTLPPNAEAEIFFGPIEGLRLTRTVLDRNEGDRGIITRSNEEREAVRIEIENITDRAWDVTLQDAVPYSEQEDLVIDWEATPAPDVTAVDDQRGILEWQITLPAGESEIIELETTLTWPDGMVLR
ncbi:mucoidy inhibitor MuiA family protein [Tateyamaria armeniaca]|uniref:Mucoidy inhibitor MuiA family protein n=1 Tax=Tateyamaria armeniaca TaxID=2518930 RepID=A0ABW8UVC5_9RHOB